MAATISTKLAESFFRVEEAKIEAVGFSETLARVHRLIGILFKTIVTFIQLNTYSIIDIKTRLTVTIYHCMYSTKPSQFYLDT